MPIVSGGGGGSVTSTDQLTVNTGASTTKTLTLTGTDAGNNNHLVVSYPHTAVALTSDGSLVISSDDTMQASIVGTGGTDAVLNVTADAGASAALLDAQSGIQYQSGGTAWLQALGTIFRLAHHADPGAGAMLASTFALWLDATPGATKLMIRAKDSGGASRTASIALA